MDSKTKSDLYFYNYSYICIALSLPFRFLLDMNLIYISQDLTSRKSENISCIVTINNSYILST